MKAYAISIENGVFSKATDPMVRIISPTYAKVYDWECIISNNSLVCTCRTSDNSSQYASLKYVIRGNGFSRLVLKLPFSNPIVRNKNWLTKPGNFTFNGILILSSGEVTHRFARFKPTIKK